MATMLRLLREPLLHFLLLGALLFAAYDWLNGSGFRARDEIRVTRPLVEGLVTQFERVWQRPPTTEERQAMIDSWVRDEVFYREALAMGLERDDPIVRRRLSQKVQFILDSGAPAAPTEAELQRWLDEHADAYRLEPTYTLRQVFFDAAKRGDGTDAAVAAARRALTAGRTVDGDATMLPATLSGSASDVARNFGTDFEAALRMLPTGSWQGPVRSGFGLHLVLVERRTDGRLARLDEVRDAVARDLGHARAQAADEAYYRRLRDKYVVRIESVEPPAG
jgi:hypothetical protein